MIRPSALFKLVRPKQWTKNLFVFSALVFSKHLFDLSYAVTAIAAFFAFSFTASFVYIINDIVDRDRDRLHPKKRNRPIASGAITVNQGYFLSGVMLALVLYLAVNLEPKFTACLGVYLVMNLAYSFFLKDIVLIDVFVIAIGFMLRVVGGALAISVPRSSWLLLTTMFLSLFLAIAKRRGELVTIGAATAAADDAENPPAGSFHTRRVLEHYSIEFAEQMTTVCAAGFVFSYALYTVSDRTVQVFGTENLILTTPFVLYGVFRYLYLLHKKNLGENPTEIMISDLPMIINFIAYAIAMLVIIYFHKGSG